MSDWDDSKILPPTPEPNSLRECPACNKANLLAFTFGANPKGLGRHLRPLPEEGYDPLSPESMVYPKEADPVLLLRCPWCIATFRCWPRQSKIEIFGRVEFRPPVEGAPFLRPVLVKAIDLTEDMVGIYNVDEVWREALRKL